MFLCWLAHKGTLLYRNRARAPAALRLTHIQNSARPFLGTGRPAAAARSRQVPEAVGILGVPLQILALDQILDALFYKADIGREAPLQLRDHLHEQLRLSSVVVSHAANQPLNPISRIAHTHRLVLQDFAGLHDAHDGCIDGVAPVLVHLLLHLLLLVDRRQGDLRSGRKGFSTSVFQTIYA